jgi:hypothetical protein
MIMCFGSASCCDWRVFKVSSVQDNVAHSVLAGRHLPLKLPQVAISTKSQEKAYTSQLRYLPPI